MPNDQALAQVGGAFNSEFVGWTSGGLTNPRNGLYFCDQWFFTAVRRGRQTDIGLEPLNLESGLGLRLLMRDPPEMVRIWHKLPDGFLESGKKVIKVRVRGVPDGESYPQLDAAALFQGTEAERKVDRKLFGPLRLEQDWREFTSELRSNTVEVDGARYITLRFSGRGAIELDYCRAEAATFKTAAWPAAKGLAAKMLSGFRDNQRLTTPARQAAPETPAKPVIPTVARQAPAPAVAAGAPAKRAPVAAPRSQSPDPARSAATAAPTAPSQAPRGPAAPSKPVAPVVTRQPTAGASPAVPARAPAPPARSTPLAAARAIAPVPVASAPARATAAAAGPNRQRPPEAASVAPSSKRPNLLLNTDFGQWSGRRLDHWEIEVPSGAAYVRAEASADRPFNSDGLSLTFRKVVPGQGVQLSQRITALEPRQLLEVVIVGCADTRTEIEIALTQGDEDATTSDAKARLTLWPRWQLRTARIQTPPNWKAAEGRISLKVPGEPAKWVQLAFVAAGPRGTDLAPPFEIQELRGQSSNALVNSTFDYWAGPLRRPLSVRRVEVIDEWALVNKSPSPNVEARLTEIVPRGLRDGQEYPSVLGLAVHGEIAGSYLRMEAALDALQILAGPPRQLTFFARTAIAAVTGAAREQSTIQQIFVAERRRLSAESDEFAVSRLFTIRRNLRVSRIGEPYELELRAEHRALLASKAKDILRDPTQSLLLIFECSGSVDLAIGSVSFGSNPQIEQNETEGRTEITLEDPHIAAQLTRLKGVEHWQLPMAMKAAPYRPQAAAADQASWSWLPDSKLTADIVICVYNAIEETLDCLESIRRCTTVPHTVTIIDDGSNDLTREQLRRYIVGKPWMRLIENSKNLGYTRSANIGLSSSSAEWVVLLNSDTIVTPGWLEGLFEVVKAKPNAAMIGPLSNAASWQSVPEIHDVRGGWSSNPLPEGFVPSDIGRLVSELSPKMFPEATLLNGFCTLMRRDVVEQLGYLDEVAFPMGYGEENDLCLRVRKAGYTLAVADHVYVYHVKSASFGSARRAELSKSGTAQLHLKHPDVDMKATQAEMAELTSLIEVRKKLRERLNPVGGRDFGAKADVAWQAVASP